VHLLVSSSDQCLVHKYFTETNTELYIYDTVHRGTLDFSWGTLKKGTLRCNFLLLHSTRTNVLTPPVYWNMQSWNCCISICITFIYSYFRTSQRALQNSLTTIPIVYVKKSGGKQWQATPKNLPRMQRTRAIPFAWLNSGLCPDRPKGWIPIINVGVQNKYCTLRYK